MTPAIAVQNHDSTKPSMIYLNGRDKPSFRCDCGCNVFTNYQPDKYRCNGCKATYTVE